jgi:type 1 fimbriae regulatory protein FimB/type 1 fimbriae regulatory protein FimE
MVASKSTPPRKPKNKERRSREHLLPDEVEKLIQAAKKVGRHGSRDSALIMIAYRHAMRVSEIINLRWDQIDLKQGLIYVSRLKSGNPSVHPLRGVELRALRQVQRKYPDSPYVFVSERGGTLTDSGVRKMIARAGELAGLPFPVHPHMLRHAAGYYLASKGHDTRAIQAYLGHRNIQHTVRYTELAPGRFNDFWRD